MIFLAFLCYFNVGFLLGKPRH
ncbi:hypothetical protein A5885_000399, partial [Enterococcus sp. 8E11_MSG4843]